ncbi:MAG TPA: Dabb family protein [Chitinophagaceae bacterium]|nr:Dabb family protein [Chitinophagaceae bacterium]
MRLQKVFIHHVYFWLKEPSDADDSAKLVEGLKKLSVVSTIRSFHIGRPATTSRDVIENTYHLSWLVFFNNKEDQDSYQADPIHLQFVQECSHLWSRVVVFDSIDAEL